MSFYVTLLSNSYFPKNTQSNFTTQLINTLNLDGKYEVAITDFYCTSQIKVLIAQIQIKDPFNENHNIEINMFVNNNIESPIDLANQLNKSFKDAIIYGNEENLAAKTDKLVREKVFPNFIYDQKESCLLIDIENKNGIIIKGTLSQIFFNEPEKLVTSQKACYIGQNFNKIIQNIAIYTDFIQDQIIGNVNAPILQVVNLNSQDKGDTVHSNENPHYNLVNKNTLSTINIRVLDLQGNQIIFNDIFSVTILKLHFRKVQNE